MAKGFKFQNTTLHYPIYNEDDTLFKDYYIDTGNVDLIKQMTEKSKSIQDIDEKNIDSVVEGCKEIINVLLDNDFDKIYEKCNKNIVFLTMLISDLMNNIESSTKENFGRYK